MPARKYRTHRENLTLELRRETKDMLRAAAAARGVSIACITVWALRDWFRKHGDDETAVAVEDIKTKRRTPCLKASTPANQYPTIELR